MVRATPIKSTQKEDPARRGEGLADTRQPSTRGGLFTIPQNRKNIFTSKFIPKVKMVGNTENLAPVPTLATAPPQPEVVSGPEQVAGAPVLPATGLSATDADNLFASLFPGLMKTEAPVVVHPGLPEEIILPLPHQVAALPKQRNRFPNRRQKQRPEPEPVVEVPRTVAEQSRPTPVDPIEKADSRKSLFNRRQQSLEIKSPNRVSQDIRNLFTTTKAPVIVTRPSLSSIRRKQEEARQQEETVEEEVVEEVEEEESNEVYEEEVIDVTQAPKSRFRFRPKLKLRPVIVTVTTPAAAPSTSSAAPLRPRHRFTPASPRERVTEEPEQPEPVTALLPVANQQKGLRSFLKSRSRSSHNGGRQPLAPALQQLEPELEIPGGGSGSPRTTVPASSPAAAPAPTIPPTARVSLLDLARTDFLPTQPPAPIQAPTPRFFPTPTPTLPPAIAHTDPLASVPVVPAFLQQPHSVKALLLPENANSRARNFFNEIPSTPVGAPLQSFESSSQTFTASRGRNAFSALSNRAPVVSREPPLVQQPFRGPENFASLAQPQPQNFREQVVAQVREQVKEQVLGSLPAFPQPSSQSFRGRSLRPTSFLPEPVLPRNKPVRSRPQPQPQPQPQRPAPQPQRSAPQLEAQRSAAQPVRLLARSSESGEPHKHMVVMQARSQLKPFLPKAENEGDALEKLRAKIESLQNTNRHRGRG